LDKPHQVVPMSIFWLLPQYILMGLMEFFLTIGQLELYYKEAPESMCSLGNVLFLANMGAGNFWASGMVKLVVAVTGKKGGQQWIVNENINRCRLDYFFGFLTVQMAFVVCLYLVVAQRYEHQKAIREIISGCNATCNKLGDVGPVKCKPLEECPTACHPSLVKENIQA
jgi:dipeptide/tripeptide permease